MTTRTMTASGFVIAAALVATQGWAQQTTAPDPAAPFPAETQAPAPAPIQPDTTDIPASEPATEPADPLTTAQPGTAPYDPTQPAPVDQAQAPTDPVPAPADPDPAPVEQAQAAPAEPEAGSPQVVAFVDQQFPALDADGDGKLTQAEFEGWISQLKTAELESAGQPVDQTEVQTYAQNAFLSADRDADKLVTKEEVTQFFAQA